MKLDPALGLSFALSVGVLAGLAVLTASLLSLLVVVHRNQTSESVGARVRALFSIVPASAVAASAFCATFSVANVVGQLNLVTLETFRADLASGALTLRIVSIVLLVKIVPLVGHMTTSGETVLSMGCLTAAPKVGTPLHLLRRLFAHAGDGLLGLDLESAGPARLGMR